jgi:predicted RNA methylase
MALEAGRKMNLSKDHLTLFLISFLSLYFEMIFIRWTPAEVKVLAYFTNFILIASVFGLGLGCLMAKRKWNTLSLLPPYFLATVFVVFFFKRIKIGLPSGDTLLLLGEGGIPTVNLYVALILFYLTISILFVPFGQKTGRLINMLPPLQAYGANILGSLAGVIIFFLISMKNLSAPSWFIIGIAGLSPFFWGNKRRLLIYVLSFAPTLCLIFLMSQASLWSPYNKVTTSPMKLELDPPSIVLEFSKPRKPEKIVELPREVGFNVHISNVFYQYILDLSPSTVTDKPYLKPYQKQYDYPYKLANLLGNLEDVLIVGAGTGNDAAGALRQGAKRVDVVEIDPILVELGKRFHPENPYQDDRISIFIDDARSFMKKTPKKYDLVVFGLLDSHQVFSCMSNARLDSFVYTVESFQDVSHILKDNGILSVNFALGDDVSVNRMYGMIKKSFDMVLFSLPNHFRPVGVQFLAANHGGLRTPKGDDYEVLMDPTRNNTIPLSTDDWPFFYMKRKAIPMEYMLVILLTILVSFFMAYPIIKGGGWYFHFFFLGSAFMLLETRSITSLALLYGSTWIVNSTVIGAILLMILLSTFFVSIFRPRKVGVFYCLLFASLVVSYLVPLRVFLNLSPSLKFSLSSILFSCPIFMAGIVFAIFFRDTPHRDKALAFNLIGLVAGGLSEYASLVTGFRYLLILVFLMYLASYLIGLKRGCQN